MKIYSLPDGDAVHRYKKSIVLSFAGRRHVLSTGPNNGGYREDLQAVFNHDMNPGAGMACVMRGDSYEEHMNRIALESRRTICGSSIDLAARRMTGSLIAIRMMRK